ncbi:MAG: hypothetical protein ABJC62_03610 [Frankiaceae bacterium]
MALRAGTLGIVTGGRSSAGVAAVASTSSPADVAAGIPLRLLAAPPAKLAAAAMLLGEFVIDKLPNTPSRMVPPALLGRIAMAAITAGTLAQRHQVPVAVPVTVGALGAVVGSVVGLRWRQAAAARDWPDLAAALAEDVLVLGLAWYSTV